MRNDLGMSPGKMVSQAGHAYVGAILDAQDTPDGQAYAKHTPGTKVALQGNLAQLGRAVADLQRSEIPHFVVVDSGCPDFFDGQPTITALGFGPATKNQIKHITKKLKLL